MFPNGNGGAVGRPCSCRACNAASELLISDFTLAMDGLESADREIKTVENTSDDSDAALPIKNEAFKWSRLLDYYEKINRKDS